MLSVVAQHLDFPLSGGFVGVDIFFTISGYLIGSIILRQSAERRFTFAGFYERRIRRIFPALFLMLLVSCAAAYRYLLPTELIAFAKSLAAVSFFISNFYFWTQSGYFGDPASVTPLLHTWSLAVEEQFYLCLPLLLVLLHRFAPRRVDLGVYLIATLSFLTSIYGAFNFPSASFFLSHTRAWELLLGTILALESCPKIGGAVARHIAGIAGLSLIAAALVFYGPWTPFPGVAAVLPCLGTAMVIAAGESGENLVGRLLSLKPIAFIGLMSYSLYLWHWPLIVFHKLGLPLFDGLAPHQSRALIFALSMVLAVLSWRFVELPFRRAVPRFSRRALFAGAAAATLAATVGSAAMAESHGLPFRFPEQARELAAYLDNDPMHTQDQYRNGVCFIDVMAPGDYSKDQCLSQKPDQKSLLLLGDSHAAALWWGFYRLFPEVNVMQATASGCKPVLTQQPRQDTGCAQIMNFVLRQYLPSHKVDAVLMEARWNFADMASLGETIAWLQSHNIPIILLGPMVQYDSALPRLLAMSIDSHDPLLPQRHLKAFIAPLDGQMAIRARDSWHVTYVSMFELLCDDDGCAHYGAPGVPLQFDYGHLTKAGSILAARRIAALGVLPLNPD